MRGGRDWKRRESLGSALAQLALAAVLLSAGVYGVYRHGHTREEVSQALREARGLALRGNPADLRAALRAVDRALALDPDGAEANALAAAWWTDLWLDHQEPGAEAKAKASLEKARAAGARSDERFGAEAQHRLAARDFDGVVAFVEGLRRQGGSGPRLRLAEGLARRARGDLAQGRAALVVAMDEGYRDGAYACALGEALLEEGVPGAVDAFTRATTEHPGLVRAQLGLALARLLQGERLDEVERRLQEVLRDERDLSRPQKARALAVEAGLLEAQGRYAEAVRQARSAVSLEPREPWARLFLARALAATADPGASAAFTELVDLAPASPAFAFEGVARLQRAGEAAAAMALLERYEAFFAAVKVEGPGGAQVPYLERDDRPWLARGDLARSAGRTDEALAAYERAIAAKAGQLPRAVHAKASLLLALGRVAEAGRLLADITPPDGTGLPEAYLSMGEVRFALKEWGAGCQSFALGLARLRDTHAPSSRLTEVLLGVEKRLVAANQRELAKLWMTEAKPLAR